MKSIVTQLSTLLIASALFAACQSDDHVLSADNGAIIISPRIAAASSPGNPSGTDAYAPEDQTLLTLYFGSVGNSVKAEYSYQSGIWANVNNSTLYWDNLTKQPGSDIYPFFAVSPQTPATAPAVNADQNTEGMYKSSDLLIAYTATDKRKTDLSLDLRHVLSQLRVTMTSPVGGDQLDLSNATLTISGAALNYTLAYTGTVATKDGTFTVPCAEAPAIATATPDATGKPATTLTPQTGIRTGSSAAEASTANYIAVVPPQMADLTFTFTIGDKQYTHVASALDLKSGESTWFQFTARKSGVELNEIKLIDWTVNSLDPAEITVTLDGNASEAGDGNAFTPADGTTMNIWKKSTDAESDRVNPHLYTKNGNAWTNTSTPIYVDGTDLANDRFYATIANGTDPITNVEDLIGAGPAQMGAGKLNFGFTHLMAQLAVNVKKGTDFPADIDLSNATVSTPSLKNQFTLSYNAANGNALMATANATETGTIYIGLATGVTTDATTDATTGETPYLVVPQTLAANAQFTLTVGDKTYVATLANGITLEAGKKNVLTLTLNPTGVTIDGITLADWTSKDTTGEGSVEGVTNLTTALENVDQAGTLHLVATTDGTTLADNGHGIYPVTYDASTGTAAINEADADGYQPILWDHLAALNNGQAATYVYRALFVPTAYRHGATANDGNNHELDYLIATSAATSWGTSPSFTEASGTDTRLKHALAQLTVVLKNDDDTFTDNELKSAIVTTVSKAAPKVDKTQGTLNIENLASSKPVTLLATDDQTRDAIIAPQPLQDIVITIKIGGDDKTYTVTPAADAALTAGEHLTLTATLKRTETSFTIKQAAWTKTTMKEDDVRVDE